MRAQELPDFIVQVDRITVETVVLWSAGLVVAGIVVGWALRASVQPWLWRWRVRTWRLWNRARSWLQARRQARRAAEVTQRVTEPFDPTPAPDEEMHGRTTSRFDPVAIPVPRWACNVNSTTVHRIGCRHLKAEAWIFRFTMEPEELAEIVAVDRLNLCGTCKPLEEDS